MCLTGIFSQRKHCKAAEVTLRACAHILKHCEHHTCLSLCIRPNYGAHSHIICRFTFKYTENKFLTLIFFLSIFVLFFSINIKQLLNLEFQVK